MKTTTQSGSARFPYRTQGAPRRVFFVFPSILFAILVFAFAACGLLHTKDNTGGKTGGRTISTHNHTYGGWAATGGPNTEEQRTCSCGDKQIRVTGTPEGLRFFTYTGNPSLAVGKSTTGPAPAGVLRIPAYRRSSASAAYQPVLTIGASTQGFQDCTALTSVIIPDSVTNIRTRAFAGCTSLKSVTIGNGVQTIDDRAFKGCKALTSVTLPNSVTIIRQGAFTDCTALKSVTIGNGVQMIEFGGSYDGVFQNCTALTSVTIGSSVTNINRNAFKDCKALKSVTIPNSVKTINYGAFEGCAKLASVTLGSSVANIAYDAFANCYALTSIHIPASVTSMMTSVEEGNGVFGGCESLKSITVDPASRHYSIQDGILYDKAKTVLYKAPPAAGITGPVSIPGSVQCILEGAFYTCTKLTSVTIPASVKSIHHAAFFATPALTSVRVLATTPPTAKPFLFARDARDTPKLRIYVPSASVAAYRAAAYWSPYASVIVAAQ